MNYVCKLFIFVFRLYISLLYSKFVAWTSWSTEVCALRAPDYDKRCEICSYILIYWKQILFYNRRKRLLCDFSNLSNLFYLIYNFQVRWIVWIFIIPVDKLLFLIHTLFLFYLFYKSYKKVLFDCKIFICYMLH